MEEQLILITGASSGIGKYLYEKYSDQLGEQVFGTYYSTFNQNLFNLDITSPTKIALWFNHLGLNNGNDDKKITLINCAAINYNSFGHKADPVEWKKVVDINLTGTFNVIRGFLPFMRKVGWGRIINFSSVVGQKGVMGTSAYAASKSGLWGMTRALALENISKGITINNINLGYSDIGMTVNDIPKDLQEKIKNEIPSKRFCKTKEIFKTVQFLINNSYITGTSIDVNGGLV